MPFGAHETMEMHEVLMEKINAISHFNLYAGQANNPQLRDMIVRHQQEEIASYNEIVSMTRGNTQFTPIPPNTEIRGINHQQIQYGLHNPPQMGPQTDAVFSDSEIAIAMLLCHKNGARNCTWAALECADPNLRRALMNCAATCTNQAYEVFLLMNEQGIYQVPTMKNHTTQTLLHSYQPAGASLQSQYGAQVGQNMGYGAGTSYRMENYASGNAAGRGASGSGQLYAGSPDSVLYGGGQEASSTQHRGGSASTYGNMNNQGNTPQ